LFSPRAAEAARAAAVMAPRFRTVLACELVAAIRALRQRGVQPAGTRLLTVYERGVSRLPADDEDRPLDTDVAAAEDVIDDLAEG
jgi:histidine ammonia-lyase